jgi:hypothetical protein
MSTKPAGEMWLSLEQVSQVLDLPWFTVWRWARDGDPRLPAYRFWNESNPRLGSFRFRQQDLDTLQTRIVAPPTVDTTTSLSPPPRARRVSRARVVKEVDTDVDTEVDTDVDTSLLASAAAD